MRFLRSMCSVTLNDRLKNEVIRERCGVREDVLTKIEKSTLRQFGHVERMSESFLFHLSYIYFLQKVFTRQIHYHTGNAGRGRTRRTYIDLIAEVHQKDQVRRTRNRRARMIRCMNVDEACGVSASGCSFYALGKKA